jgi:hypothetical protein
LTKQSVLKGDASFAQISNSISNKRSVGLCRWRIKSVGAGITVKVLANKLNTFALNNKNRGVCEEASELITDSPGT